MIVGLALVYPATQPPRNPPIIPCAFPRAGLVVCWVSLRAFLPTRLPLNLDPTYLADELLLPDYRGL
jgi:hypothetical protein